MILRIICFMMAFPISLAGCFSAGPAMRQTAAKLPLTQDGEVNVYLQPLPQEADRLRFVISGIFARHEDGRLAALSPVLSEVRRADLAGRQKLLATGVLAPGRYTGLAIQIGKALVPTPEGEADLLVPDEPIAVDHAFEVRRQSATTLFLALDGADFVTGEVRFTPAFSLASAGRGLINMTGLVSNSDSHNISVFDKKTMQVVDTIATGARPMGLVLDQIRARAYVADARDDTIEVIDVFKRQVINRLKLNFRDYPVELALTPDGRTLLAVNQASNTVSLIDALSMTEVRRINVGEGPASAVVDPAGRRAYVMNSRASTISVVDLTQNKLAVTIGVEAAPLRGAFNRSGSRLYVISSETPNLAVIDADRFALVNKIFIEMGAVAIAVDRQADQIYVGKKLGGEIAVVDPSASMFIDTIQVDGTPVFMAIDGEERSLLVVLADRKELHKINLTGKKQVGKLDLGEGAYAVVVMGERQ